MQTVVLVSAWGAASKIFAATWSNLLHDRSLLAELVLGLNGQEKPYFVCDEEHFNDPELRLAEVLKKHCPKGKFIVVPPHQQGLSSTLQSVLGQLDPEEPAVFFPLGVLHPGMLQTFETFVHTKTPEVVVGAHCLPFSWMNPMSSMVLQEQSGQLLSLKESVHEPDPATLCLSEWFYLSQAAMLHTCLPSHAAFEEPLKIWAACVQACLKQNKKVTVFPFPYYFNLNWPANLLHYEAFSRLFLRVAQGLAPQVLAGDQVIYLPQDTVVPSTEPALEVTAPVSGASLLHQVCRLRRATGSNVLITHQPLPETPEGWDACTDEQRPGHTLAVWRQLVLHPEAPLTLSRGDHFSIMEKDAWHHALQEGVDLLIWQASGDVDVALHPDEYVCLESDPRDGNVYAIRGGHQPPHPWRAQFWTGDVTFGRGELFLNLLQHMSHQDNNNRYTLLSVLEHALDMGFQARVFDVPYYLNWHNARACALYHYWQGYFHHHPNHPYTLTSDTLVPEAEQNSSIPGSAHAMTALLDNHDLV